MQEFYANDAGENKPAATLNTIEVVVSVLLVLI